MMQVTANEMPEPNPASAAGPPVPATDVERFLGRAAPQLPNDNTHELCLVSTRNSRMRTHFPALQGALVCC